MPAALDSNAAATSRIVAAFVRSVLDVLHTMVHVDVKVGKPFLKQDGCPNADDLCGPCNNPTSSPPNQPTGACPP